MTSDTLKDARERLLSASSEGNLFWVQESLEAGVRVNSEDADGRSALHLAAMAGHPEVVSLLLANGALVGMQDFDGRTAIEFAVAGNHREIIGRLLAAGGEEETLRAFSAALEHHRLDLAHELLTGIAKGGPLSGCWFDLSNRVIDCHRAVEFGSLALIKAMLEFCANPTLLMFLAAGEGRIDLIEFLFKKRGETGRKAFAGTCGHLREFWGRPILDNKGRILSEMELLFKNGIITWGNQYFQDTLPMHFAAACGQLEVVRWFLEHGFEADQPTLQTGRTPLFYAVENHHPEVIRCLLENHARLSNQDHEGLTPFLIAIWEGHPEVLALFGELGINQNDGMEREPMEQWLLRHRALVELASDIAGEGLQQSLPKEDATRNLCEAVESGNPQAVRRWLRVGADVNGETSSRRSFLMTAIIKAHGAVARLLIRHGAAVDVPDVAHGGNMLVNQALERRLEDVAGVLLEHGADPGRLNDKGESILHTGGAWLTPSDIRILLEAGVDANHRDQNGRTPLFRIALEGSPEAVRALIEGGADHSIGDQVGQTPLLAAIAGCRTKMALELVLQGADPNVIGDKGRAALHWAVTRDETSIIEVLLKNKARIDLCDEDGRTSLLVAIECRSTASACLLIAKGAKCEVTDRNGKTALYLAVERGLDEVAEKLLGGGANPHQQGPDGRTPADLAVLKQRHELARLLRRGRGKTTGAPLKRGVRDWWRKLLHKLGLD